MSAPQLPHVSLDDDWFRSDYTYAGSRIERRTSTSSSAPSQYSESENPTMESAKTSVSSKPTSGNDVLDHSNLPTTEYRSLVTSYEPAATDTVASVPVATPENQFLGFCKGAWNLQNGDQKGSMKKCSEADAWSRSAARNPGHAQYLKMLTQAKCREPKCDFRSNFISSNVFLIWNKVFIYEERGIKLRWPFLAKSHVPQRVVLNSKYSFQCLFCVYLDCGKATTVYSGMDLYLDHINQEHRGRPLGDVIAYKTRCIGNRIADDKELFDVNIWPKTEQEDPQYSKWLSDDLLEQPRAVTPALDHPILPVARQQRDVIPLKTEDNIHTPNILNSESQGSQNSYKLAQGCEPSHCPSLEDAPVRIWRALTGKPNASHACRMSCKPSSLPLAFSQLAPESPLTSSSIDISLQDLLAQDKQIQIHAGLGSAEIPSDSQTGITRCLDSIVQLFREAGTMIDAIKDNPDLSHTPIVLLLAESVREAPSEIEKEKNRAILRFGEAFQYGDYTAICALRTVASQLRKNFLDLLNQTTQSHQSIDIAQLVDTADHGRYATIAALHDLKQRLVRSGYGTYQPPRPQAHPAYQSRKHSGSIRPSPSRLFTTNTPLMEQRYGKPSRDGREGVEDVNTTSASSDDASIHVHFRDEDSTARTARRSGYLLGLLKYGRLKSNSLLVDSKRKSDELAARKMRDGIMLQRQNQEKGNERPGLNKSVIEVAEMNGSSLLQI